MLQEINTKLSGLSETNLKKVSRFIDSLDKKGYSDDFEKFWAVWKKHVNSKDKFPASKAFEKAIGLVDVKTIIKGIESEVKERELLSKSGEFVPQWENPSTWLNKRCWENEAEEIDWNNYELAVEMVEKYPPLETEFLRNNND